MKILLVPDSAGALPPPCNDPVNDPKHHTTDEIDMRDWFAAREQLTEWDSPDAVPSNELAEALAGPKPEGGWRAGNILAMVKWEAAWRAGMKYIRADAMIAARKGGAK